jgi:hypothetical protein
MNTTATLRMTMVGAAFVGVVLSALPAFAAGDTSSCNPATCTSPVLGPGNHLDEEVRYHLDEEVR